MWTFKGNWSRNLIIILALSNFITLGLLFSKRLRAMIKTNIPFEEFEGYKARVKTFQAPELHLGLDILVSGDSHAQYLPTDRLFPGKSVANHGISGDVLQALEKRAEWDFKWGPKHVVYIVGINNLNSGESIEKTLGRFRSFFTKVQTLKGSTHVLIVSLLPVNEGRHSLSTNQDIRKLNSTLEALVREHGLDYLDAYPHLADSQGQLPLELTDDGLHLTPAGNQILVGLINQSTP